MAGFLLYLSINKIRENLSLPPDPANCINRLYTQAAGTTVKQNNNGE